MNKNQHITDELLTKQMLGETSAQEEQQVQEWLKESEEHQQHYDHFKKIWDNSKRIAVNSTVDVDDAWARFQQRVERNDAPKANTVPFPTAAKDKPKSFTTWLRAAAIMLLIAGGGLTAYLMNNRMMTVGSGLAVTTETLPDGTVVTLNKNSSISYHKNFKGKTRNVTLHGEAFFDVTPNKDKPFIIDVDGVTVRVVGTSFNVKSTNDKTEVVVATGIVTVSKNKNAVQLTPDEIAIVKANSSAPIKMKSKDNLYNYYRTKEFVCDATPLWRLVEVLNEAYDKDIKIKNKKLKDIQLSTRFSNESLDMIFNVIQETYKDSININIEHKGDQIIIK